MVAPVGVRFVLYLFRHEVNSSERRKQKVRLSIQSSLIQRLRTGESSEIEQLAGCSLINGRGRGRGLGRSSFLLEASRIQIPSRQPFGEVNT